MNPIILKLARDDLKKIRDQLLEYGNIPPLKFRASFEKFCGNVAIMPYMYAVYDLNPVYRRAVLMYGYLVFYRVEVIDNQARAKVYRVLYGKRNMKPLLDSELMRIPASICSYISSGRFVTPPRPMLPRRLELSQ